jgi:hypothetical protein
VIRGIQLPAIELYLTYVPSATQVNRSLRRELSTSALQTAQRSTTSDVMKTLHPEDAVDVEALLSALSDDNADDMDPFCR